MSNYPIPKSRFLTGTVKSVQDFSITLSGANYSGTATITEVDPDKCDLFYLGYTGDTYQAAQGALEITNGTTITARRGYAAVSSTTIIHGRIKETY
ncbi:hypothetical protein [uncultured Desulfobacter sp.]|uniref:hypothetical protein n=1 Tax=uncultured Desulfobacter sp. TaxID=240139 RepID=UPI002AAAAFC3|nr:hypothetical protein [uncultured Desulfobacter sp.]